MTFTSVIFDWRGTLVTTLSWRSWVEEALCLVDRERSAAHVDQVLQALQAVDPGEVRLEAPGVDSDAALHRSTYLGVFADAGLDPELSEALYAVESDHHHNHFASDVAETLRRLREADVRVAVLSDVHFDIRPAFAEAGTGDLVDAFVLSFEQGVQKPDPAVFATAVENLGAAAQDVLMVGDRSRPDGAAVEHGITTLLLPPLRGVDDRRLHHVLSLCGLT